jgi:uncharacterized protein YjbJ (UPF0337 family)
MPNQSKDKWEGRCKQAVGKAKEEIGEISRDERLKAEGCVDRAKGQAQEANAKLPKAKLMRR